MNESSEIKVQINKLLKKMQLPREIKETTNSIYKEYEEAYKKFLLQIKQKNILESKEMQKLESYIKSDYKEDMQMTELVEFEEYEQGRTRIIEVVSKILTRVNSKEKPIITQTIQSPTEKDNKSAANIIINTTISEIQSSGKNIISKLHLQDEESKQITTEFEEDVKRIIEDAKQRTPEISEILNNHYHEVCEQLSETIERYNNGLESPKEEIDMSHIREEFRKRISYCSDYKEEKRIETDNTEPNKEVKELDY